ncbi:MAG: xanthine dehydrogenase accessory protein XdhC, partial [Planktomarina sp.]|nr:xanthine dehydrogenase accessory protein XdhC [Planktomarina sp.]
MSFDLMQINAAIAAHGEATRVVIVDIKGSSPREIGASMLLWPGGQSGSIGGGALEYQASLAPQPGLRRYPLGPELGQCCGGHVTLVTEHFTSPVDSTNVFIRRIEGDMAMPLQMAQLQKGWRNGSADPAALICTAGWLAETLTPAAHPLWIWGAGHVG